MKTYLIRLFVAFAWLAAFGQGAIAAVTFTVTPSAVSNTYNGTITLQIGGLTNKTVVVQKYLDLNTNGVIDGGDLLVQQFTLQDGTSFVIGGVTNSNVPGDLNATTGAITATLNFQNGDFVQNIVGNYLYVLSSPGGHFAPITNQFAVTNYPFLQTLTGNVVSNSTSTTLPNAIVLLFPPPVPGDKGPSGNPLAGVVANNAGRYTVQAPPGTYMPVAFKGNYAANLNTAPVLTLAASQTITTNLVLTNATTSISGSVVDANNSSIGLPGVMVPATSSDGLLAIAFTDTNGNFNIPVTAGNWKIEEDDTALIVHGYLKVQNGTNVAAGAGVTLAVPEATALIYGSVKDNLGNPLVGLDVYASDNNNLYETDGYTDANGNYVIGVLGLGEGDSWYVQANDNSQLTNYVFSQSTINGNISAGTAVLQNFTAILATNHITGSVKDNGNNPIVGVGVSANATINGTNYQNYVDTDANGNYWLNVANGTWNISINCNGGSDSLDDILGSGSYEWPTNQFAAISGNNATNNFIIQPCSGIQIFTTSLPGAQVGNYYDITLQGSSCNGTLNWTLNDPPDFPSSLAFGGNGEIQGMPDTSGTFTFTVQLNDGNGHSTNQTLSLYIAPAPSSVSVQNLFVAAGDGNIYEFTTNGARSTFASGLSGDMEGLAFDSAGNLFVSDAGNSAIYKFTTNGVRSTFASGLNNPRGLAFDSAGNLFQADAGSGNIYKYTPSGSRSTFASGLGWPMSLAFDSAGNLYEADWDSNNIYKFTTNGVPSTFVSGLNGPWGLAFDSAGNLYETDFYNNEINKFTTNGVPSTFASWLSEAEGLAFDSAGNLCEANQSSGYVYQFTPGGARSTFASGLNSPAALVFQPVLQPLPADALLYYAMKMESVLQTNAANVVPDTSYGPFSGVLGIIQSSLDSVPIAIADLPSGAVEGFPLGTSGIELQVLDNFGSQAALDAVYTNGNYTFAMATMHDGFQFPVLTMPVAVYPSAVRVGNFAAAQAINPQNPFILQWTNPPDATASDYIWVTINDGSGNMVFSTPKPSTNPSSALNGTATSVMVPANTFQSGNTYTGFISFFRGTGVNTAAYPGVTGLTLVSVRTRFSMATFSALPVLSQPVLASGTQFGFLLGGFPGQNYTILATTNLSVPMSNWFTVLTTNLSSSPALIWDNHATNQQRFYRVKVGP